MKLFYKCVSGFFKAAQEPGRRGVVFKKKTTGLGFFFKVPQIWKTLATKVVTNLKA